jgi:hypothetical protein
LERTWTGRVRQGAESEHARLLDWLNSSEGRAALGRALLTSYRLVEEGVRLSVTFGADEPPPIIRFLRNPRFWPDFWEFESAERGKALGPKAAERVVWSK